MPETALNGRSILCFGELLLRLNTAHGVRLSEARDFEAHIGGSEGNVAAALAALGHTTELITVLPTSSLGDLCLGELRRAAVGVQHVRRFDGRLGTYFLEHGSGPRSAAIVYDRAESAFCMNADVFDWEKLAASASWLHLSGINLPLSTATAAGSQAAVEIVTAQAVPVSFDVNHRASLWKGRDEDAAAMERSMMKAADVLFASSADLTRALGHELTGGSRNAAEAAFKAFPRLRFLVSTRREATAANDQTFSVRVDSRDDAFETDLASVGPPVDRIGSGDAVAGAALDAILRGASVQEIARNALAAGVLKIGIAGDRWVGTRAELEAFGQAGWNDVKR